MNNQSHSAEVPASEGSVMTAELEGAIGEWLRDVCGQMSDSAHTELVAEIMRVDAHYAGDGEGRANSWRVPRVWWLRAAS